VSALCAAAPKVLFGAAFPGQGGTEHVNEQWQSYWARKFSAHGYRPLDIVRPQIISNQDIPTWYRNNTILYVRKNEYRQTLNEILDQDRLIITNLDGVIPDVFESPGLKHSLRIAGKIPAKIYNSVKWRMNIRRWRY
jgi:hypothetical protein